MEYGHNEYACKVMISKPQTELSKYIGRKWYLTIEKLSEKSNVSARIISTAIAGKSIGKESEAKIRRVLKNL